MSFKIENTQVQTSVNNSQYVNASPQVFVSASDFGPQTYNFTSNPENIYFPQVTNGRYIFITPNSYEFYPEISGMYLVSWSFTYQLNSGSSTTMTANVTTNNNDFHFTFPVSNTIQQTSFSTVIACAGFAAEDLINFSMSATETLTLNLIANSVTIQWIGPLTIM